MRCLLLATCTLIAGCSDGSAPSEGYQLSSTPTVTAPRAMAFLGFRSEGSPRVTAWANDLPLVTEWGSVLEVATEAGSGSGGRYIAPGDYLFSFRGGDGAIESVASASVSLGQGDAAAVAVVFVDTSQGPAALPFVHHHPVGLSEHELALQFVNLTTPGTELDLYQCATRSYTLGKEPDCTLIASELAYAVPWREVVTVDLGTQFAVEGPEGFERLPLAPRASPNGPPEPSFAAIYHGIPYGADFHGDGVGPY